MLWTEVRNWFLKHQLLFANRDTTCLIANCINSVVFVISFSYCCHVPIVGVVLYYTCIPYTYCIAMSKYRYCTECIRACGAQWLVLMHCRDARETVSTVPLSIVYYIAIECKATLWRRHCTPWHLYRPRKFAFVTKPLYVLPFKHGFSSTYIPSNQAFTWIFSYKQFDLCCMQKFTCAFWSEQSFLYVHGQTPDNYWQS